VTTADAWALLETVPDPELPVLSVVDLGIVRDVEEHDGGRRVVVTLTPTYSGCPATEVIARDVRAALEPAYDDVDVRTRLSPAWTTDWLSEPAHEKLRRFGIMPPTGAATATATANATANVIELGPTIGRRAANPLPDDHVRGPDGCPRCGSPAVEELAAFGSTPCKALWRCTACREPFDYFKPH
jgi:ring-1,2-phenylacetyl-CoA epoxidase subunit PaaD